MHAVSEPKEFYAVPGARHVSLYDNDDHIAQAVQVMHAFFQKAFGGAGNDIVLGSDTFFFNSTGYNDTIINFDTESDVLFPRNTVTDFTSFQDVLHAARFVGRQIVLVYRGRSRSLIYFSIPSSSMCRVVSNVRPPLSAA